MLYNPYPISQALKPPNTKKFVKKLLKKKWLKKEHRMAKSNR